MLLKHHSEGERQPALSLQTHPKVLGDLLYTFIHSSFSIYFEFIKIFIQNCFRIPPSSLQWSRVEKMSEIWPTLKILDVFFSLFFVGPFTVLYWRGTFVTLTNLFITGRYLHRFGSL